MPETITQDSKPSFGVTFERTISDGNYGSNKFSAWVSADVPADATETQKYDALANAAAIAKALVYDQLGVEAHSDENDVIREATAAVKRAFPGTTDVTTSANVAPTQLVGGVRIKGTQHGEVPKWLLEDAEKAGVSEVYDNRDGLAENPKRPWFKATTGGKEAKGFWPPSNRR